ncbi:hypothetical protein [Saccharopolyspora shandongensis]|uniref:hypothetical protein n=1 Tax=Saccharopolyspora shandongensis TaxID=418495 RepID=UPI0015A5FD80|nr:hypothetical protein [Saccharopolyspora shandongensis]
MQTSGDRTLGQLIVDTRPLSTESVTATAATVASVEVFREVLRDAFGNTVRDLRGSTS